MGVKATFDDLKDLQLESRPFREAAARVNSSIGPGPIAFENSHWGITLAFFLDRKLIGFPPDGDVAAAEKGYRDLGAAAFVISTAKPGDDHPGRKLVARPGWRLALRLDLCEVYVFAP
jgi:hypothetical protein